MSDIQTIAVGGGILIFFLLVIWWGSVADILELVLDFICALIDSRSDE